MSPIGEPSLHFKVLGSVDLRRADGSQLLSLLAQPKRVALLTYVAMEAAGGFVPRERIMSVLWPDSDTARARQSLRTSLYQIRHSVGAEVLTNLGSGDVGVSPDLLFVDAVALRAAVAGGRFHDAVDLYKGPFLLGFHLDDAPEFEEWAAKTRATLEGEALRAFREAAREREASGEIEAAGDLLRRAQELAPADEEILRHRLLLLADQGNRAGAVAEGEEWIETLRSSLEIEPSEPTLRLMRDLRSGSPLAPPAPVRSPAPSIPTASRELPAPVETPALPPASSVRDRVRGAALRLLPATAALALLTWIALRKPPTIPPVVGGVIVVPFDADSASGGPTAGVALGALTARYLQPGTGGIVVPASGVPAASFDGRDRRLIRGHLRAVNGRLVADVSVATTLHPKKVLARATASVDNGDLEALAIVLANELAGPKALDLPARGPIPRFTRAPGAIIPFFRGEILARENRAREASDAFRQAIALDSTFAMAYYRLSLADAFIGHDNRAERASDRALDLSVDMTGGERKLLDAWRAYQGGGVEEALPLYEALAASRGPDPDVWLRLAEIRFHWGPQLGIPRDSAAAAFRVLLRLVPSSADALLHLVRLMGPTAAPDDLQQVVRRLDHVQASTHARMEASAIVALNQRRLPDDSVARWVTSGSFSMESRALTQFAASARVPYDLAPFVRSLPPTKDSIRRILRRVLLAQLAASAGRMREAYAELDTLRTVSPYRAIEYRCFLALSSPVPTPADTLRALQRRLRSIPLSPGDPITIWAADKPRIDASRAIVLDAMLSSRLGEPIDSATLMARGRAESHKFDPTYVRDLEAVIQERAGNHARVLAALGPGSPASNLYPDPFDYLVATSKWARIQSLVALGRYQDALRWLGTIPDPGGYDLLYLAPASLLRGRILERLGRDTQAAVAYARAATIWAHADPDFASLRDSAWRGAERTGAAPAG